MAYRASRRAGIEGPGYAGMDVVFAERLRAFALEPLREMAT
jgi:hypothetical protein